MFRPKEGKARSASTGILGRSRADSQPKKKEYTEKQVRVLNLPSVLANGIEVIHEAGSCFRAFRCRENIGGGTYAKVWRVIDRKTDKEYAAKLLQPHIYPSHTKNRIIELFTKEVLNLAMAQCPGVVRLDRVVSGNDGYLLLLEFADGGTVWRDNYCKTEMHSFTVFLQVLQSLLFLQQIGIVHRDLKPTNILRFSDERIIVADFGWSELVRDCHLSPNEWPGTLEVNPPEVLNFAGNLSEKIDNYALGMNLLLFVCGRFICRKGDLTLKQAAQKILKTVQALRKGAPPLNFANYPDAWSLFLGLTHPDPVDRFSLEDVIKHKWVQSNLKLLAKSTQKRTVWHPKILALLSDQAIYLQPHALEGGHNLVRRHHWEGYADAESRYDSRNPRDNRFVMAAMVKKGKPAGAQASPGAGTALNQSATDTTGNPSGYSSVFANSRQTVGSGDFGGLPAASTEGAKRGSKYAPGQTKLAHGSVLARKYMDTFQQTGEKTVHPAMGGQAPLTARGGAAQTALGQRGPQEGQGTRAYRAGEGNTRLSTAQFSVGTESTARPQFGAGAGEVPPGRSGAGGRPGGAGPPSMNRHLGTHGTSMRGGVTPTGTGPRAQRLPTHADAPETQSKRIYGTEEYPVRAAKEAPRQGGRTGAVAPASFVQQKIKSLKQALAGGYEGKQWFKGDRGEAQNASAQSRAAYAPAGHRADEADMVVRAASRADDIGKGAEGFDYATDTTKSSSSKRYTTGEMFPTPSQASEHDSNASAAYFETHIDPRGQRAQPGHAANAQGVHATPQGTRDGFHQAERVPNNASFLHC